MEGTTITQVDRDELRYIDPARVAIAGTTCEGMTIRASTGKTLGHLHGFVADLAGCRLRYLVIRTSGWLGRTSLVPFDDARVNVEHRTIEVSTSERETRPCDVFPTFEGPAS